MAFNWTAPGQLSESSPYRVTTQAFGSDGVAVSGWTVARFDRMNRENEKQSRISGKTVVSRTYYDRESRVIWKSEPYFDDAEPASIYWTNIQYDLIGRPVQTTGPQKDAAGNWTVETVSYSGVTKISTNPLGQTKTVYADGLGRPLYIVDHQANGISYTYDAIGQTVQMASTAGTYSQFVYNERGHKIWDYDPDKGWWAYRTNALGLVVEQTNAKGQVTRTSYDILGRPLTRVDDANAINPSSRTATWTYDDQPKAIGKQTSAASAGYRASTTFDQLGRPSAVTEVIGGQVFTQQTTYDARTSRPDVVTYASGVAIKYIYDAHGGVYAIANAATGARYFIRQDFDARGNVTKSRLGNAVETVPPLMALQAISRESRVSGARPPFSRWTTASTSSAI
jgi:YD repeat-containing protein